MSATPRDPAVDLDRIERVVRRMPRLTRALFLANRRDGLSVSAIAERTGLTRRQVAWHLARALLIIERALDRGACQAWWRRWF